VLLVPLGARSESAKYSELCGADWFLTKPLQFDKLEALVNRCACALSGRGYG
jgi:hypothetical protein